MARVDVLLHAPSEPPRWNVTGVNATVAPGTVVVVTTFAVPNVITPSGVDTDTVPFTDNGDGTWTSALPTDNGDGSWTY